LTDGVLDRLYPGYENSSYYHDESGFLTPTPFGDSADCLLSDAPAWLLGRYALLVVTGELAGGAEIRDKLAAYVQGGGHLVITAGNVAKMPGGLAGVRVTGPAMPVPAKQQVDAKPASLVEDAAFELLPLEVPAGGQVLMQCGKTPAAIELSAGKGKLTVLASPFGVGIERATQGKIANPTDGPLAKPFPLLKHVAALLDQAFRRQTLFEAGPDLQVIACRKDRGVYTVGLLNNAYHGRPFSIVSHCGARGPGTASPGSRLCGDRRQRPGDHRRRRRADFRGSAEDGTCRGDSSRRSLAAAAKPNPAVAKDCFH
jgi:hypothetical protein